MAESLLGVVASKVLDQVVTLLFTEEIGLVWGVKADLRKLQNTINNVKAVILDAEEAQLTSHEVCTWLAQLKDVLFDAEDLFNEFTYESLRKQLVNSPVNGGTRKKVRRFFSVSSNPIAFRLRMRRKVRDIREAFDDVAEIKAKFHLNTHRLHPSKSTLLLNQRELTHSFVDSSQIVGRDGDRVAILDSLTQSCNANLEVVSVVGMGGLGKTALAKLVFNDLRIDHFDKKIWVCLGDLNEFSVTQVMVKMVKSFTGEKNDDWDPEKLQRCLREILDNNRFLLVLDDVWVVERAKWLELKELLICGAKGSKVLVTTRDSSVASNMGSILAHSLEGLPHEQCVSLFKKFAFNEGEDDQNLMRIGDVIVGKCRGVPLAIKTLGCLLFSKQSVDDWVFVRDNEIWQFEQKKDDILPALKISYNQLPFNLKQCFLYCSVFPKDHEFHSFALIQHWLGYGLLRSSVKSKKAEDIGQQYIHELCVRGFFQDYEDFTVFIRFKMHDLFHDLALSETQSELTSMKAKREGKEIYKSIRHVSFSRSGGFDGEVVPKLFLTNESSSCVMPAIWSVSFGKAGEGGNGIAQLVEACVSELKHLRIMELSDTSSLEMLPSSIGGLKHLRFLSLERCKRLKTLPDSFCRLHNLQTLSLSGCDEFERLPKDIGDLVNLRHLSISTRQKRLYGIERLNFLQELRLYGCNNLEYIFESHHPQVLASLRTLVISNCPNLKYLVPSALSMTKPRELSDLESLLISYCPNINMAALFSDQIRLARLKCLILYDLPQMETLPEWINYKGCVTTLELLTIGYCESLASLPDWLSKLTSLRRLFLCDCPELLCMPEGLSALIDLEITECPALSRRCKQGKGEDWPKIEHIPKIMLDGEYQ